MDKRRTVEIIHKWIPADESHEGKWVREERLTRCRACRWLVKKDFPRYFCQYYHHATRLTDFCSRAERRRKDDDRGSNESGIEQGDSCPTD